MKKKEKILIGILLILLVIVGSIYINVKNTNKGNAIQKQEISKGQLSQTEGENAYVSTQSHLAEVNAQNQELTNLNTQIANTTVTADRLLKGYTAYKNGQIITGTMANNGAVTATINAGGSYTIPAGYHNGSGKVTASALSGQTSATATAAQILSGKTAWVNGAKITGTMANKGAVSQTLNAGGSYTIPAGYHNGSGKVTAKDLASQTQATATADNISAGKTAWVNGKLVTGNGADNKAREGNWGNIILSMPFTPVYKSYVNNLAGLDVLLPYDRNYFSIESISINGDICTINAQVLKDCSVYIYGAKNVSTGSPSAYVDLNDTRILTISSQTTATSNTVSVKKGDVFKLSTTQNTTSTWQLAIGVFNIILAN